jgi:hypothetical protein
MSDSSGGSGKINHHDIDTCEEMRGKNGIKYGDMSQKQREKEKERLNNKIVKWRETLSIGRENRKEDLSNDTLAMDTNETNILHSKSRLTKAKTKREAINKVDKHYKSISSKVIKPNQLKIKK